MSFSGTWIAEHVICRRLITVKNGGPFYDGRHHLMPGINFSSAIKEDREVLSGLREIAVSCVRLYEAVENDPRLFVPAKEGQTPLTGMKLLWLMEQGQMELASEGEHDFVMTCSAELRSAQPDADALLRALFEDLVWFAGDDPAKFSLTIREASNVFLNAWSFAEDDETEETAEAEPEEPAAAGTEEEIEEMPLSDEESETDESEAAEPETDEFVSIEPETVEPEAAEPEVAELGVDEPEDFEAEADEFEPADETDDGEADHVVKLDPFTDDAPAAAVPYASGDWDEDYHFDLDDPSALGNTASDVTEPESAQPEAAEPEAAESAAAESGSEATDADAQETEPVSPEPADDEQSSEEETIPVTEQVKMFRQADAGTDVRDTLMTLKKMISDIEGGKDDVRRDERKYDLTFENGEQYFGRDFSVDIPDGFRMAGEDDGTELVIWLPNAENPSEWEASVLTVNLQRETEYGNAETGDGVLVQDGSTGNLNFRSQITRNGNVWNYTVSMIGVKEGREEDARETATLLLEHVH